MASNVILAKMAVLIDAQTAEFNRKLSQSENNFRRFGGNVNKIATGFGVAFGAYEVLQGVQRAIGVMSDFEKTMSEVKAITGTTGDEFKSLERDALRLGASTAYTSTQVGQLQIAYGRLGFTTKEILDATEATLDLAAATGEDLAKSADVAGSTVRGFQLNAKETQRVVDVMAASFNKTALGLENFTESMKYVAPVANAAGATVEETTALLGVLADAGIRGSMAGTSLRKIFTDMTKDGRPLQERLAELAAKGITLQDSFDEVGRTAQTSLLILANNTEKTRDLTAAFQDVSGEASKMARIMRDNLSGDTEKLSSAWEGLILRLGETGPIRRATQAITGLLNALTGNADIEAELNRFAMAFKHGEANVEAVVNNFVKTISKIRQESGKPIDIEIVKELAEKYQLTSDQAERFYKSVLKINEAMSFQETAMKQFNEFVQRNGYKDLSQAVDDYKDSLYRAIVADQIATDKTDRFKQFYKDRIADYRKVIAILNEYKQTLVKPDAVPGSTAADPNAAAADSLEALKKKLNELNEVYDKMSPKDFARQQTLAAEILALKDKISLLETIKKLNSESTVFSGEDAIKDFESQVKPMEQVMKGFEAMVAKFRATSNFHIREVKKEFIDLGPAISGAVSSMASALGSAANGTEKFGKVVTDLLGGFMQQFGSALVATGVGKVAFDSFSGPGMIAAGAVLVAAGAALKATIKSKPNLSSGVSAMSSSATASNASFGSTGNQGVELIIGQPIEFRIQGEHLVYILNRQDQLNGRTR